MFLKFSEEELSPRPARNVSVRVNAFEFLRHFLEFMSDNSFLVGQSVPFSLKHLSSLSDNNNNIPGEKNYDISDIKIKPI